MGTKQQVKDCIDLLQTELNKSAFASRFSINVSVLRDWQKNESANISRQIECFIRSQNEEETAALSSLSLLMNEKINLDKEKYSLIENFSIQTQLREGQKFPGYENITNLFKQTSDEIKHHEGEVILIDLWATWCKPCQTPMHHNQEMLLKNSKKWGDKVRIFGISVDDRREEVIERVESRKWDKIIHLKLNGFDKTHPLMKDFQIDRIPFFALIDTEGNLNYIGYPSDINLEERIQSLLEKKYQAPNKLSSQQHKHAKLLISKQFSEIEDKEATFSFQFQLQKTTVIQHDSSIKIYEIPSFNSKFDKSQEPSYKQFKKKTIQFLGKDFPLKKEQEIFNDPKSYLNQDLNQLRAIFEENSLKTVETQHEVNLKFNYQKGKFIRSRKDNLKQHSKLHLTQDLTAEKLEKISGKVQDFTQLRYRSNVYGDYLFVLLKEGLSGQEVSTETIQSENENHQEQYRKFKEIFESGAIEKIEQQFNLPYQLKLKLKVSRHRVFDYQGNMTSKQFISYLRKKFILEKYYGKPNLIYSVRKNDLTLMQSLLDKIFEHIPQAVFKVTSNIIETVKIEIGTKCEICSIELGLPQYYNYFKKQYLCIPCGDKRDTSIKTIKQFAVTDNLIFINSPNVPEFELQKLGRNIKPNEDKEIEFNFQIYCSGCQGNKDARYICLECNKSPLIRNGFIDFCKSCFEKITFEKNEDLLKSIHKRNGHQINHSFFLVKTPEQNYFNY